MNDPSVPACYMCGLKYQKGVPLCLMWNNFFCGNCLLKILEKKKQEEQKWLQESINSFKDAHIIGYIKEKDD